MKRAIAVAVVVGLLGGVMVLPADAKKKKKKKKKPKIEAVDLSYYLRRDDCGTSSDNPRLSLEDGPDGGNWCGEDLSGLPNEVLIETDAQNPETNRWPSEDGEAFTLDVAREVVASITIVAPEAADGAPRGGAGKATVDLILTGTIGGEEIVLGTSSQEYDVAPDKTSYTKEFRFQPDQELAGSSVEGLELQIVIHGAALGHSGFEYEDPASFITVPALVRV